MLNSKSSVAALAAAALLGETFSVYSIASVSYSPDMAWSMGWIATVFTLSITISVMLAIRGTTVMGTASVAAAGLGLLASGIERGETVFSTTGAVCIIAGLAFMFLQARFSPFSLYAQWGLGAVAGEGPRERHTRLCRITELDERLLPLLEDTVHRYSLGDLRAATRLCCETRYSDNGVLPRGAYAGPAPVIEACVLTENLVIILIAHTEGRGVAFVGRLQQTMVSETPRREDSEGEREIYVRSAWLDSSESSSYPFPLDDGAAGREFVEGFREMLTATRHT
ncbi:hypothetical protein [Streptomyces sp. NBC_01439]|uniref:hypothetical protein n=1 Tax=Streptomyces sp. NBC_01439 TaxID=2903867 RepID=UPI002E2CD190|nr:hypothetical protein [Streptomyces sp. NBC_01439]